MKILTRKQLSAKAKANLKIIKKLEDENIQLLIQSWQLNDKISRYEEKEETHGRGKNKLTQLIGRIHFDQYFTDEDTGKKIKIQRSKIVCIDGIWQTNYWSAKDI